jgi:glycosyltransferase involved in cell wall biosynthesis
MNACIELANSYNATNIEFLPVPEGMVPEIQNKSDVMLLPVKKNGAMSSIPSKLPAYMFSSKPIIGSLDLESDTAKSILESGCGIVVEPENEVELINAMKEASEWSKQVLEEKGNAGFEYAVLNFSKKENLQKVVTVIENII